MSEEWEFPYMVIYNKNGEIGWSGDEDYTEDFRTYEEAKEFYDIIEVDNSYRDYSINWKRLIKVEVLEHE